MKTRVTLQLLEEIARFDLRFTCEDCASFTGEACAHGYPNREHRRRVLIEGEHVVFCKEFESA